MWSMKTESFPWSSMPVEPTALGQALGYGSSDQSSDPHSNTEEKEEAVPKQLL